MHPHPDPLPGRKRKSKPHCQIFRHVFFAQEIEQQFRAVAARLQLLLHRSERMPLHQYVHRPVGPDYQ